MTAPNPSGVGIYHILAEKKRREALGQSPFSTLYPDHGKYSREVYDKHIQFFAAGATFRERALLGGNRCITPWTPVETGLSMRQCVELLSCSDFDVRSWDGDSRCTMPASGVFLKSIEPAFRIHLDNGQFFDCTRRHRVLTTAGWTPIYRLIRAASGLHCWRTAEGLMASYVEDGYLHGEPLRLSSDSVRWIFPSQGSALQRDQTYEREDVAEPKWSRNHTFPYDARFSILDDPDLISGLCGQFEDPSASLDALWCSGLRLELRLLAVELCRQRAFSVAPGRPILCEEFPLEARESLCAQEMRGQDKQKNQSGHQSPFAYGLETPILEFLESDPRMGIFFPAYSSSLLGGNHIVSVVALGVQPILDFSVFGTQCYESGGVIHHNTGKTLAGAFETTCHLTGRYPHWWTGRRFNKPTRGWAAGDTSKTVAEIMQAKLMGTSTHPDAGLIPRALIRSKTRKAGVPDAYASLFVEHITGGTSVLSFKSYDQKRISFQGTAQDFIWLDEEVDESIYEECVYRTLKTSDFEGGIIYLTFTPLMGLTKVVQMFIPDGVTPTADRFIIFVAWDDIPHLDEKEKAEIYRTTQPYLRDARTKGTPSLGSGAIYPISEESLVVQPFEIPKHWTRGYGLDVGWNATAAMFGAYDRENQTLYLTSEYKRGEGTPSLHADTIKARAKGWPGFIDPASRGRSQDEGKQLIVAYRDLGLDIVTALNAVDVGIDQIWDMMTLGRLKVFASLQQYKAELRLYRRDKKGIVVKENDHLMDAKRYLNSRRDQMRVIAPPSASSAPVKYGGSMGFVR